MARYFTLAVREDGVWAPQFGDYSRKVVKEELDGMREARRDLKIVESDEDWTAIKMAIAELNVTEGRS